MQSTCVLLGWCFKLLVDDAQYRVIGKAPLTSRPPPGRLIAGRELRTPATRRRLPSAAFATPASVTILRTASCWALCGTCSRVRRHGTRTDLCDVVASG